MFSSSLRSDWVRNTQRSCSRPILIPGCLLRFRVILVRSSPKAWLGLFRLAALGWIEEVSLIEKKTCFPLSC